MTTTTAVEINTGLTVPAEVIKQLTEGSRLTVVSNHSPPETKTATLEYIEGDKERSYKSGRQIYIVERISGGGGVGTVYEIESIISTSFRS